MLEIRVMKVSFNNGCKKECLRVQVLMLLLHAVVWKEYFDNLEISIGPGAFRFHALEHIDFV